MPARRPVTRSLLPLTVVPSCLVPLDVVASGSPRSHAPTARRALALLGAACLAVGLAVVVPVAVAPAGATYWTFPEDYPKRMPAVLDAVRAQIDAQP